MSAPLVVSTSPQSGDTDVVLGLPVTVSFDQEILTSTVTPATFALTGPGFVAEIGPGQLTQNVSALAGRELIPGVFSFPATGVILFTPSTPLRPNVEYTVTVIGGNALLASSAITNPAGEKLLTSYQWKFVTGSLQLSTPPVSAPLNWEQTQQNWDRPRLDTGQIRVHPRSSVGNDLTQVVELIFPGPVDPDSFDINDLVVSVEAILNDPLVDIPANLTSTVVLLGNRITITISGWSS